MLEMREPISSHTPNGCVQEQWSHLERAKQVVFECHQNLADGAIISQRRLGDKVLIKNPKYQWGNLQEPWQDPYPYHVEKQPFPNSLVWYNGGFVLWLIIIFLLLHCSFIKLNKICLKNIMYDVITEDHDVPGNV